ncbi:hypothetical protein L1987_30133 [Smallanthus sonchifolius]|uniref:Uncharacterized protein n=1 Tax=Smallanthus sonchifolius TaxID=185202 RepID=A0ACB9I2N5_9ASTR|nr:hypothetical protein L1987_30133 [Smallanthus sonchifolius]
MSPTYSFLHLSDQPRCFCFIIGQLSFFQEVYDSGHPARSFFNYDIVYFFFTDGWSFELEPSGLSVQRYWSLTWLAISSESTNTCIFDTFISLAIFKPASKASFSASLLVLGKSNRRAYVNSFPSEFTRTKPAPEPSMLEAPSTYSIHVFGGYSYCSTFFTIFVASFDSSGTSVRKLANT